MKTLEATVKIKFFVPDEYTEADDILIKLGLLVSVDKAMGPDAYRTMQVTELKEVKE